MDPSPNGNLHFIEVLFLCRLSFRAFTWILLDCLSARSEMKVQPEDTLLVIDPIHQLTPAISQDMQTLTLWLTPFMINETVFCWLQLDSNGFSRETNRGNKAFNQLFFFFLITSSCFLTRKLGKCIVKVWEVKHLLWHGFDGKYTTLCSWICEECRTVSYTCTSLFFHWLN